MRQNDLDVSFIVDLAAALGVSPRQLLLEEAFDRHTPAAQLTPDQDLPTAGPVGEAAPSADDRIQPTDCQRVTAVRAEVGGWVYVDDLADSLGWTVERVLVALEALGALLPAVGQRLAWLNDREVRLCGDHDAEAATRDVTSRDMVVWGANFEETRMLFLMVNGTAPPRARASLMAIRRLTRLGHMEADPFPCARCDDLPRLTPQARFDLCLDELGLVGTRKYRARTSKPRATDNA